MYYAARRLLFLPEPLSWDTADREVTLRAKRGLALPDLIPIVDTYCEAHGPPGVVIICLGTNDLRRPPLQRRLLVNQSVSHIKVKYPQTLVVWSDILHRQYYDNHVSQQAGACARRALNDYGRRAAHAYITHHHNTI